VAVVVPGPNAELDARALVEWTNSRVGKQQRIRAVVCRASLPRNANGKVLKRELRQELADLAY
jgi:acyl-CoA synthetase (AMP-forming)/AMP-acid ligase II